MTSNTKDLLSKLDNQSNYPSNDSFLRKLAFKFTDFLDSFEF